jgi:hypothetical protein
VDGDLGRARRTRWPRPGRPLSWAQKRYPWRAATTSGEQTDEMDAITVAPTMKAASTRLPIIRAVPALGVRSPRRRCQPAADSRRKPMRWLIMRSTGRSALLVEGDAQRGVSRTERSFPCSCP